MQPVGNAKLLEFRQMISYPGTRLEEGMSIDHPVSVAVTTMQTKCSHCSATYKVSDTHQGKRVKCPKCQQSFLVEQHAAPPTSSTLLELLDSAGKSAVEKPKAANESSATPERDSRPSAQDWDVRSRHSQVMSGFQRKFQRPRTSSSYRLGMTAAMVVMLLLPVLYFCFVAGIAWLVWLHLSNNGVMFQQVHGRAVVLAFMLYLAPAVAGLIAIVFMFKPLLAKPVKQGRIRSLTAQGEPVLFDFVKRICDEVGAPIPKRIDINNDVNASASFRAGWWSILRGNDLVLTLGMPLISGLSLQQLAGVIAHEFGHFSQGAGMRVSYVLRSINHWFVRAVYERDSWDAWLEAASHESDIRIGWIFYFARLAVWVSRRFLWCLMFLGYLLTGIIQKQMEFDADRYEVEMAGKKAFASTFRALRTAGIGYQQAMGTLGRIANEGRLVSDIPKLATVHAKNLPQDKLNEFLDQSMKEKANFFDSHPCDHDRIAAAANASDQGAFQSGLPASALMQHFEAACVNVTKDTYDEAYGKNLSKLKIIPTSSVIEEQSREDAAWESLNRFFLQSVAPTREFPLPNYQIFLPADTEHAKKLIAKARQVMANSVEHYQSSMLIQERADERKRTQECIGQLKRKISKVDASGLEKSQEPRPSIPNPDPAIAEKFVKACAIRLHTCCCLLQDPTLANRIPDATQRLQDAVSVLPALQALDSQLSRMKEFEKRFGYLVFCFDHFERIKGDQSMLVREVLGVSEELVPAYAAFRKAFIDIPYPFEHATASVTVGQHLTTDVLIAEEVGTVAIACGSLISEFYNLRGRCLGKLVVAAESVETALGLPLLEPAKPSA